MKLTHAFGSLPFREFCRLIREEDKPFHFARYGDGEWNAILGVRGKNCDGHVYSPKLRDDLTACLTRAPYPSYYLGMQSLAWKIHAREICDFTVRHRVPPLKWIESETLHRASGRKEFQALFDALAVRSRILLVGPPHLEKILPRFGLHRPVPHLLVPEKNCHEAYEEILGKTREALVANRHVPTLVAISASMSANVMVHQLAETEFKGVPHSFVDFGSLWDPYCGKQSRRFHKDPNRCFE